MIFMKQIIFILFSFLFVNAYSQDTTYARQVIKKLTSKELFGRGYVKDGVNKAASYISKELKTIGLSKFGKSYSQIYEFPVNTFPGTMSVVLDGKTLVPGTHYLVYPSAERIKGGFQLFKTDSVTYEANDGKRPFHIKLKLRKKLTYTVATQISDNAVIELLKDSFPNELKTIDIIYPTDSMERVMDKFEKTKVHFLPVLKEGKYYGFISKSIALEAYRRKLKSMTIE